MSGNVPKNQGEKHGEKGSGKSTEPISACVFEDTFTLIARKVLQIDQQTGPKEAPIVLRSKNPTDCCQISPGAE